VQTIEGSGLREENESRSRGGGELVCVLKLVEDGGHSVSRGKRRKSDKSRKHTSDERGEEGEG